MGRCSGVLCVPSRSNKRRIDAVPTIKQTEKHATRFISDKLQHFYSNLQVKHLRLKFFNVSFEGYWGLGSVDSRSEVR